MTSSQVEILLPEDEQTLITCEIDAPKDVVYKAYTAPELAERWHPGQGGEPVSIEWSDFRVGGRWRSAVVHGGQEFAVHGTYREIVPEERLVSSRVFEGMPDVEAVETVTFTETDGRTRIDFLIQHERKEDRDAYVASGVEDHMQEEMDLLEELARSLM